MPPAAPKTATLAAPFVGREADPEVGEMFIACVRGGGEDEWVKGVLGG